MFFETFSLQLAGLILGLTTVITIAAGHVLVRRLHARFGTRPAVPLFLISALVLLASLFISGGLVSGILGISGVTIFWDGIEVYRQEKRMNRSHVKTLER